MSLHMYKKKQDIYACMHTTTSVACVYIHTFACLPTYLLTSLPTSCLCACLPCGGSDLPKPTCAHTYIHTYRQTYIPTYIHIYIHPFSPTAINTHTHNLAHMLTTCVHTVHACRHTYIHTHARCFVSVCVCVPARVGLSEWAAGCSSSLQ